ncbi:MAG: DUF2147 domain-containing protein [Candidatus Hydrogenedentes bacterium]|nr:DUF2147 domain-containing protein [Candidatus Hydrogenedentota bacterium]
MMRHFLCALALLCASPVPSFGADTPADGAEGIVGTWLTEKGEVRVKIERDGDGKFFGTIVWMNEPVYPEGDPEAGKPCRDRENPDKARRNDPILGMRLLSGFEFDGKNTWKKGTVYDAETGNTYKATLTLAGPDSLKLRGYIGISLLGRNTTWTRQSGE